jgi:hypothetical protein
VLLYCPPEPRKQACKEETRTSKLILMYHFTKCCLTSTIISSDTMKTVFGQKEYSAMAAKNKKKYYFVLFGKNCFTLSIVLFIDYLPPFFSN